ncbi:EF-hand domain-containing protein [Caulobacter sp.]|uniref:EF-hand domain-containing protein n=1 Tax=Caulobacter sp. TaxID=78 RepID=UPI0031DDFEBE
MTRRMIVAALVGVGLLAAMSAAAQPSPEQAKAMFAQIDTNKDGALSAAEWKAAGRRDRGFEMADTNKDGKITPEELRALAAKYGK